METRFRIVFEKLRQANATLEDVDRVASFVVPDDEIEEIRELQRLAALAQEPEPSSYTST